MPLKHKVLPSKFFNYRTKKQDTAASIIDLEKEKATERLKSRQDRFKNILFNSSNENPSLKYIAYGFGDVVFSFFLSFFYTAIPTHNVILQQEYWYELPLQTIFTFIPLLVANNIFKASFYTSTTIIKTHRHFQMIWIVVSIVYVAFQAIVYMLWTNILLLRAPVPLNGYLCGFVITTTCFVAIWYMFPYEVRKNSEFRKRLNSLVIALIMNTSITFQYGIVTKLFILFPKSYQWTAALLLPCIKEFNQWIMVKLISKSTNGDFVSARITCEFSILSSYALFIVYTIGSIANSTTSMVLLGVDCLSNLLLVLQLICFKKKHCVDVEKQMKIIQTLVMNEMIEFMVPLAYVISFVIAYYGPNANLIGNISNDYWQYSAVENIRNAIKEIMIFFFFSSSSLVLSSILLWKICRINLYYAYVELRKEFGLTLSVQMALGLNAVRF